MFKQFAVAAALTIVSTTFAQTPITSTFDAGSEGWVMTDLTCSNFNSVIGTYAVDWIDIGGDPAGHIGRIDPSGNCYFFDAPGAYLGDRSAFIGRTLRFSLRTTVNDWLPGSVLALIGDGGKVLVHDFAHPNAAWKRYSIPLDAASFRFNSAGGPAVSPAQFAAVMADLEALRISAEYGDDAGEEYTTLDSVAFGVPACPGDLDLNGTVDGADLAIVLGSWGACAGCVADIDGNGVVDGGDLAVVLGSWGACPA